MRASRGRCEEDFTRYLLVAVVRYQSTSQRIFVLTSSVEIGRGRTAREIVGKGEVSILRGCIKSMDYDDAWRRSAVRMYERMSYIFDGLQ